MTRMPRKEFAVTMAPINGGLKSSYITVKVIALAPTIASAEANRLNPQYIAVSTRTVRVIRAEPTV